MGPGLSPANGCLVNASRCGRLHCYITGPIFLLAAIYVGLSTMSIVRIRPGIFLFSVLAIACWRASLNFPLANTRGVRSCYDTD
jgi:hypothetical protein